MEDLFGKTLLKNGSDETIETSKAFEGKEIVGLYFSASWCPPCKSFSPLLKEFYHHCNNSDENDNDKNKKKKSPLEIVFISSDQSVPSFQEYYKTMPWLAVPVVGKGTAEIKQKLATKFQVVGIPCLIILDVQTGYFITDTARDDVANAGRNGNAQESKKLLQSWKNQEAVPIEQAVMSSNRAGPSGIVGLIFTILKNPIYIFGLLYMYKWFMRKLNEQQVGVGVGDSAGGSTMETEPPPSPQYDDSEF